MAWTERAEIKHNCQDIADYLKTMHDFHDYRIGHVSYNGSSARIIIEEDLPGTKPQDDAGLVWDFHFEGVSDFQFDVDCVIGFWISEVEPGDQPGQISFNLHSGSFSITAEKITLGIPTPEKQA